MHCSPGLSCIDHVTDHVLIMFGADGGDITKDTDACALGYISVTPLTVDRTARDVFEKLNK